MNLLSISENPRNTIQYTREILFFDQKNTLLFSIPDESYIRLNYENGEYTCAFCKWIDQEHTEINGQKFNNYEFFLLMKQAGIFFTAA